MSKAHTRKKDPEAVRRSILDCASSMAADAGLAAVSVQAVSEAAGVTKGAFFHHFENKQALVEAVFADLIDATDSYIEEHIAENGDRFGCFTRAYIESIFAFEDQGKGSAWSALWLSAITDPTLVDAWNGWLKRRLKRHAATDDDEKLVLARMAADGLWLSSFFNPKEKLGDGLKEKLLASTRKGSK